MMPRPIVASGAIVVRVLGTPVPQGSKTAARARNGRAFVRDANPGPLARWRKEVTTATRNTIGTAASPLDGPLQIDVTYWFTRPGNHYGTGRNSHILKSHAPTHVATIPDIDKLLRSTFDGLADGGAYVNDSRIVRVTAEQRYANHGQPPGAMIVLEPFCPNTPPDP